MDFPFPFEPTASLQGGRVSCPSMILISPRGRGGEPRASGDAIVFRAPSLVRGVKDRPSACCACWECTSSRSSTTDSVSPFLGLFVLSSNKDLDGGATNGYAAPRSSPAISSTNDSLKLARYGFVPALLLERLPSLRNSTSGPSKG